MLITSLFRADDDCTQFNSSGIVVILDVKNTVWKTAPPTAVVREIVNILRWIYPARLDSLFVVNASWAFHMMWNVVKSLVSANTLSRIKFIDSDKVSSVLLQEIGGDYLELEYGGRVIPHNLS